MNHFRCRSIDRKQELARLRLRLEEDLKPLTLQSIAIRRLPSREQHCRSQETEIVVCFSSSRIVRARIAKPVGAIGSDDFNQLRLTHTRTKE